MTCQLNSSIISIEEQKAQNLVQNGNIDEAIAIYQNFKFDSPRIFFTIGTLYGEKKGDYELAIHYFERALRLQEMNGDDTSNTHNELGNAYQNLREYEFALLHHFQALNIEQITVPVNKKLIACSLFGIANAYWGLQNLSEALNFAQQALTINESIESNNEYTMGANLAILSNIYHATGDDIRALELAERALIIFERYASIDSVLLAPLLNNIGTIQISMNMFNEALLTFVRVLNICEKTFPEGHPKRVIIENNIQLVREMQDYNHIYSYVHLWDILTKFLLF